MAPTTSTPNLDELARRELLGQTKLDLDERPTSDWLSRMAADADSLPSARQMTRAAVVATGVLSFTAGALLGAFVRLIT